MKLSKLLKEKVSSFIMTIDKIPFVYDDVLFKEAIDLMNLNKLGIVCIVDKNKKLKGVFTDGDIRRKIIKIQKPFSALFADDELLHTNLKPITINENKNILNAIKLMNKNKIWDLPVISNSGKLLGLLHMNDILKKILDTNFD